MDFESYSNMVTCIVDMYVILDVMKSMYNSDKVREYIDKKVIRLKELMESGKNER